ncbi:hypothetical protein TcasGA2_TC007917 [Tribolium castaneum]|uniref:Uncharacterized protein n=1 Tax=Tribolium castaneum TaxID=7070 RepID=D2A315_TRICA|nr:hypothetical protein TcasGA2_TC007917 [Tribolium castaneum]
MRRSEGYSATKPRSNHADDAIKRRRRRLINISGRTELITDSWTNSTLARHDRYRQDQITIEPVAVDAEIYPLLTELWR